MEKLRRGRSAKMTTMISEFCEMGGEERESNRNTGCRFFVSVRESLKQILGIEGISILYS